MNGGGAATWEHHHHEEEEEEEEGVKLSGWQLVRLAETHLRVGNYTVCREYAVESLKEEGMRLQREASEILAMASILCCPGNYYGVLQVDTFCEDQTLIRSKFRQLLSILEPIKHKSAQAREAVNLVWKAYGCLSDPTKKSQFDASYISPDYDSALTFWSFCPYCLYVYEYGRVYEGCSLRCQNQRCRRAFHGVALPSPPKSTNLSYFPLGFSPDSNYFRSWSPFVTANNIHIPHNTNTNTNHDASDQSDNVILQGADDMAFFQEGGEIFVHLSPSPDAAL